jgi:hypothetical protein
VFRKEVRPRKRLYRKKYCALSINFLGFFAEKCKLRKTKDKNKISLFSIFLAFKSLSKMHEKFAVLKIPIP